MEDVLITTIVFGSILAAIKLWFDYLKTRRETHSRGTAGKSLTESELRLLVQEAVGEALQEHMARLEKRLVEHSEPRLIPAGERGSEFDQPAAPPVRGDRESVR